MGTNRKDQPQFFWPLLDPDGCIDPSGFVRGQVGEQRRQVRGPVMINDPLGLLLLQTTERWAYDRCTRAAPSIADALKESIPGSSPWMSGGKVVSLTFKRWAAAWPLPVGVQSSKRFCEKELSDLDAYDGFAALLNLMPFDGDELAILAISYAGDGCTVDIFGLADSWPDPLDGTTFYSPGPTTYRFTGQQFQSSDAKRVVDGARHWWGGLSGLKFRGRPRGSGSVAMPDFPEKYPQAYAAVKERMDSRPTHTDVSAELGLSRRSFYDYLKHFELPFPPA